jgi:hypothetical protein
MAKKKSISKKAPIKKSKTTKPAKKVIKKATSKKKPAKPKKGNDTVDLECFLSTACIQHKHLPDQCEELQVLRKFRDEYMRASPLGQQLVKEYYSLGPGLVKAIELDSNKANTYRYIYSCIKNACAKIRLQKNESAQEVYTKMVKRLSKKYTSAI